MLRTESYRLAPGRCFICESQEGHGIDTDRELGIDELADARVYLCDQCVREMARLIGFPSPQEVEYLRDEKIRLDDALDAAVARADQAEADLRALRGAYEVIDRLNQPSVQPKPRRKAAA